MKLRMLKEESYQRISEGKSEVLQKNRGYGVIYIDCCGVTFAIPLRSAMNHSYGFKTILNGKSWNGIDYSKALVISESDLKEEAFKFRDNNEYKKIQKNKMKIKTEFELYVSDYIKFIRSGSGRVPDKFKYSTLKYFHEELGL